MCLEAHLLVLSKVHFQGIIYIPIDLLSNHTGFDKDVCWVLQTDRSMSGFNILHASGLTVQQSVPHFHVHMNRLQRRMHGTTAHRLFRAFVA
ncbi:HIT domain-containing protein [Gammaproteobacteria bacterium LSUCC0112]|nr:HIT domain-containing protein [Gammaproteobacteria bacterium LSUCC0112]